MDEFSFFRYDDPSSVPKMLLQTVVDNIPIGIEALKAVYNDGEIIDFGYIFINEAARTETSVIETNQSSFLASSNNNIEQFRVMKQVVETGRSAFILIKVEKRGAIYWYSEKMVKYDGGIVLYREEISDRNIIQEQEKQNLFKKIADSVPDMIYVLDYESRAITYLNQRGEDILGLSSEQVIREGHDIFFQIIHPDDYLICMNHFTEVGNDSYGRIHEIDIRKKIEDGTFRWFRSREKIFKRDRSGKVLSIIGICTDVDDKKQSESVLEETKLDIRLFKHFPDIITRWDKDLKLTYTNRAFETRSGDVISFVPGQGYNEEFADTWREKLRDVFISAKSTFYYHSFLNADSRSNFHSSFVPEFNKNGELISVLAFSREITSFTTGSSPNLHSEESPKFKRITDSSHNGLISLDINGVINYCNPAAELNFGYDQVYLIGKSLSGLIFSESNDLDIMKACQSVISKGVSVLDIVGQIRNTSGRQLDMLINIYPLRDYDNVVTGACVSLKDITEKKKAEQRMREDAHLIGQIVETSPDIIYIMDLSTRQLIYSNRQIGIELGYTRNEIAQMNNPFFEMLYEDDIPRMIAHLKKVQQLKNDNASLEIEYRLKNADGSLSWFCDRNSVFKRNSRGVPVEKIGICQNITSRKDQEEMRRTNLDIIQQSELLVDIGSWEYDIQTDEFKWSDGMYRLFNLPQGEEVRPEIYLEYMVDAENEKVSNMVNSILHRYRDFEEVITLLPAGTDKKILKVKAIVQYDKDERPVKMIGVDLDITQQVKSAQEINKLYEVLVKKNSELEMLGKELKTFNIVAAHDYKDTLQQLYTNLEYIVAKDARNLSDTSRANIRRAQSAIQKLNLLTDDINSYFRLFDHELQIEIFNPNEIIRAVINKYQKKLEEVSGEINLMEIPDFAADPQLFKFLIENLIDNAIKSRNLVSPLNIRIVYSRADELNAVSGAIRDTPYVIISVQDNGLGFDESESEKVFELFYRRPDSKYKGSGIALAFCRKIMAIHNGFIIGGGHLAEGATFSCYFPLRQ